MTTQAISANATPQTGQAGLRPMDVRRDLIAVANLIHHAFENELDQGGLDALQEMRLLGRMGPLTHVASRFSQDFHDMLEGFVWEEDEKVVGNVSIQRLDSYGQRWGISNVAVEATHRGRGIARQLMKAAVDHVKSKRGDWMILQVRRNNPIALNLYEKIGFESIGGTSEYKLQRAKQLQQTQPPEFDIRLMKPDEWHTAYELAVAATPRLMNWWQPVRADTFHLYFERRLGEAFANAVGYGRTLRFVIPNREEAQAFDAYLQMKIARWQGEHAMQFYVHPDQRGHLERALVQHALNTLSGYPAFPVRVSVQATHPQIEEALQEAGFQETRTLLTMRKRV